VPHFAALSAHPRIVAGFTHLPPRDPWILRIHVAGSRRAVTSCADENQSFFTSKHDLQTSSLELQVSKQISTWESDTSDPEISIAAISAVEPAAGGESADRNVIGERFGKYLLVGELAVGGMAEIFLGVHRGLEGFQKAVVIKRVLPAYSNNPSFVQMFVDEARLAARLEHPNIIRTYEFGEVEGQYFTVMEYLPGEDLAKTLDKLAFAHQQMPFHIAAGIVANVCAGLHFAHQLTDTTGRPLGLVHRDVNPANIIVTYTGEVKLIDFGVAKTTSSETQAGTFKGKVAYMSPEQLLARGVDQRSDVWASGVVLWELLTGRPLFLRDNEGATLYAIMNEPIHPPSRFRARIPGDLEDIVMRALSRTPADRYDSAEEMGMALEACLATLDKYDARVASRMLEDLFGADRAEAKRAIAQTRSLGRNVSRVMKVRTDVRADLAEHLEALAAPPLVEAPPRRGLALALALVVVLVITGGALYAVYGGAESQPAVAPPAAQAGLQIESDPPGAAISLGGEPTGLKTPATLNALTAAQVVIRVDLEGYATVTESIDVPAAGLVTKRFALKREN
jgi:eukaryotic-like serine/threonine-protein kinase